MVKIFLILINLYLSVIFLWNWSVNLSDHLKIYRIRRFLSLRFCIQNHFYILQWIIWIKLDNLKQRTIDMNFFIIVKHVQINWIILFNLSVQIVHRSVLTLNDHHQMCLYFHFRNLISLLSFLNILVSWILYAQNLGF